jgi:hypothetical protein
MRRSRITVAAALALAFGLALPAGIARDVSAEPVLLDGAVLEWSVNDESNTGAFNGQCNFMSGGISDGSSPTYRATDGDATVLKRTAAGSDAPVSDYSTRCKDANGTTVTAGGSARLGQKVVYANGTGTMDPETGQVDLRWSGTFSINFYGQLTPFWFTDPHLQLDADGNGRITATIGGYSSSIDNPEERELIEPIVGVEIATLRGVASDNPDGFVATPEYLGVQVEGADSPQIRAFPGWGSWPVSYVRAMERLGMGSYWYTSGGAADARKAPAPLTVAYGTGVAPTTTTTAPTTTQPGGSTTTAAPTTSVAPTATTTTTSLPASTTTVPTVGGSNGVPIRAVVPDGPDTEVDGDGSENPAGELPANTFAWTVDASAAGVTLGEAPGADDEYRFVGNLGSVRVIDTREGNASWSLSGQVSDFSGGLPGSYLGWTPEVTQQGAGALPGGAIPSGLIAGDGLRSPALLASAPAGRPQGSAILGALLDLRVPRSTPGGTYTATLTLTALG